MVQEWKRIPILFCVEIIGVLCSTFNNIFYLMVKFLQDFGGLRLENLGGKMVNVMGYNNNVFQGNQTSVTLQFKKKVAPFFNGAHCFAHKMNIIVFRLLALDLVC